MDRLEQSVRISQYDSSLTFVAMMVNVQTSASHVAMTVSITAVGCLVNTNLRDIGKSRSEKILFTLH